mmetsp:Transcript_43935/g.88062  ORF Transcript_43935/g.88062 Transcript_43935/m.88062 type:complete len:90 (+) Transcript_43935:631-900(+)
MAQVQVFDNGSAGPVRAAAAIHGNAAQTGLVCLPSSRTHLDPALPSAGSRPRTHCLTFRTHGLLFTYHAGKNKNTNTNVLLFANKKRWC